MVLNWAVSQGIFEFVTYPKKYCINKKPTFKSPAATGINEKSSGSIINVKCQISITKSFQKFVYDRYDESIQSASFQSRKEDQRKIAGASEAYILLEAKVMAMAASLSSTTTGGSLIHPNDRSTASFHRSYLTSRSSVVSRGWNLSMEETSRPKSLYFVKNFATSSSVFNKRDRFACKLLKF